MKSLIRSLETKDERTRCRDNPANASEGDDERTRSRPFRLRDDIVGSLAMHFSTDSAKVQARCIAAHMPGPQG
jgi:hypothetical protein